jgi:hypothetical protein
VGERLVSATLYGSAAGDEFDPKSSDVNVAFVFSALGPAELESLKPAHRRWLRFRVTRPLLLSRESLERSADTFPLEYLLIQTHHEVLHGEDLFGRIAIDRGALRTAVERVLRTQELGLITSYLALADSPAGARHWARRASTSIGASASGLLYLMGEPIPVKKSELVERCGARLGMEASLLTLLLAHGTGRRVPIEAARLLELAQTFLTRLIDAAERLDRPAPTL